MTVVLVLVTFLIFALADFILSRGKAPHIAVEQSPDMAPAILDGFAVSDKVRYHPGHAWCLQERSIWSASAWTNLPPLWPVRSRKSSCPSPANGSGRAKSMGLFRDGEKIEMVSPTEGEVIEVNSEVAEKTHHCCVKTLMDGMASGRPRSR